MARGRFGPGNPGLPYGKGENNHTRAHAKAEVAIDVLRDGWDGIARDPEAREIIDRIARTVRDPVERVRKTAQELAPYCLRIIAGTAGADTLRLASLIAPVRVRLDAAL